jgi:hypothetical protein
MQFLTFLNGNDLQSRTKMLLERGSGDVATEPDEIWKFEI